jgi:hypothetical protein
MQKVLIFSDAQATEGNERLFSDPEVPLQRYRIELMYKKLLELYTELGCTAIWDLGDTTDDRTAVPMPTLDIVRNGIARFPKSKFNFKCTGNHEQFTRNATIDNSKMFSDVFTVAGQLDTFEVEGCAVVACSYPSSNSAGLAQKIESAILANRRKPIIFIGHLELAGSSTKAGISLGGLDHKTFDGASVALLGHVHKPQVLGENVYYVGSPFQQNFGESGEDKRVGLLTIDGDCVELSWVKLGGFPLYVEATLQEFIAGFTPESEDRWKVTVTSQEEADSFFAHPYAARARVDYSYHVTNTDIVEKPDRIGDNRLGLEPALKSWLAHSDPGKAGISLSNDELLDCGRVLAESEA